MATPLTFHAFQELRRFHPDGRKHPDDMVREFCEGFSAPVPVLYYPTEFGTWTIYVWATDEDTPNGNLTYEAIVGNEIVYTPDLEKAERHIYESVDIERLD